MCTLLASYVGYIVLICSNSWNRHINYKGIEFKIPDRDRSTAILMSPIELNFQGQVSATTIYLAVAYHNDHCQYFHQPSQLLHAANISNMICSLS